MVRRRIDEATDAMEGRVIQGSGSAVFDGAALDSRRIRGGELFFALPGERTDGHAFVPAAFEAGASAAVVTRPVEVAPDATLIEVDDSFAALHRLTRWVRAQVPEALIGITGSAGKTTTKEFLVRLLSGRFRVAGSPGNLNNLYGFPLALLSIPDDTEWMVAEMGMSTPGELAGVSRLGRPEVAVLLNIGQAHLEGFEGNGRAAGLRQIAEAKAGLLDGLVEGGRIVANGRDPEIEWIVERYRRERDDSVRVTWFGVDEEADPELSLQADRVELAADGRGSTFRLVDRLGDEPRGIQVTLPVHGLVNVENFVAAAACARCLGIPLEEIAAAAASLRPESGRGGLLRSASGARVIDDSYNANPEATRKALEAARALPGSKHLCVLGEMLELGQSAERLHREAGVVAAELGFDRVLGVGGLARELVAAAREAGAKARWFADADDVVAWLRMHPEVLGDGDVLLVKGSRAVRLERVVDALVADESGEDA